MSGKDVRLDRLMDLAEKWYSKKKFSHAMRVAGYANAMAIHDDRVDPLDAYVVAIAHDLIEDTNCPQEQLAEILGYDLFSSVLLLTKCDTISYHDYILDIVASDDDVAYLVKKADMKDHLTQVDTLSDKLKEKYLPEIHYFI